MFKVLDLPVLSGRIGICPMPGRFSSYQTNFSSITDWRPQLVITVAQFFEMEKIGITSFPNDLRAEGVEWMYFPVSDYGVPDHEQDRWANISNKAHKVLNEGGRVLCHCHGGCGRSGMVLLRLMCETGESAKGALERLRKVRPCAVETKSQLVWAAGTNS